MKILVIGAGVIGVTYAWQLSLSGNEVTLFVRPEKVNQLRENGIHITCLDTRGMKERETKTVFRPPVTDTINLSDKYDLIMVCVNSNQIGSVLPILKPFAGIMDILFFSNLWDGLDQIAAVLEPSQYFFGYPFKAGGGRDGNNIDTVIFGTVFTETLIGEQDGTTSPRVKRITTALKHAGMNPRIHRNIKAYLLSHYVWAAANVGAYMQAGSYENFSQDHTALRRMYLAMREGFAVCRAKGVNPALFTPTCFYYLPLFLLVPFTKVLYRIPSMRRMFEGHVLHSPDEVSDMYRQVLEAGKACGTSMPNFSSYYRYVERT
jgi:2-dehydropantoate 2-reductase